MGSIPGSRRSSGGGHGNPLQQFLPGECHGQRSLAGCSPWGHKEQDTTKAPELAQGSRKSVQVNVCAMHSPICGHSQDAAAGRDAMELTEGLHLKPGAELHVCRAGCTLPG